MIINNDLRKYSQEIWSSVLHYAYANYHPSPLMEQIDIDQWCGEIFNVSDIETELHSDIIEDLKTLDLYDKIKSTCDRFVILPDVWSMSPIPITAPDYPRNQYDMDRANVVILNGKVFDLKDLKMKSIKYNHNRLLYCFYNSSLAGDVFNTTPGTKLTMRAVWVYENAFLVDNVNTLPDTWDIPEGDEWYKFCIDENNHIVDVNSPVDRVGIAINSHYLVFDYKNEVDPRIEVHCPGLMSYGTDMWIRPKWYNLEDMNRVFVHNKHLIFTNTFLVLYKDGTYRIDNTYSRSKDQVIEKIDKHTIRMEKDPNIDKIIVFVKPFDPDRYPAPDSLYYKATDKNMYASLKLKEHARHTNDLYLAMIRQTVDIDWLIDYGYKYDLDVLKVIQNVFRCVVPINEFEDIDVRDGYDFFKPKLIVKVWNKLQMYPLLFINHKLYMADYRIIKQDDSDLLVLDPEQCFKLIDTKGVVTPKIHSIDNNVRSGRIGEYQPPKPEHDNYMDKEWIKSSFNKIVEDVKVIFVPYTYVNENLLSRQSGRIFRSPIYKRELILDEVGSVVNESVFKGYQFVNGCLSNEAFTGGLFRRLDGVNIYGFGDADFTITNSKTPSDLDVYHINTETSLTHVIPPQDSEINKRTQIKLIFNDTESGKPEIASVELIPDTIETKHKTQLKITLADPSSMKFKPSIYNGLETSLLINRLTEPLVGVCKVGLGRDYIEYVNQFIFADTMYPADNEGRLKEWNTLIFDKYGYECIDNVDILSSKYINCDNMYDYVANKELFNDITVHMFPITLADPIRQYDLEIDKNRIQKFTNNGSYNDRALTDSNVRALFLPNDPSEIRPIPVTKKSNYILLGQKILTRYWLGLRGTIPVSPEKFAKEVESLGGTYVTSSGKLGTVPEEFKEFIKTDPLRGDIHIGALMSSSSVVYNMFVSAGIVGVDYNANYVNSDQSYAANMSDIQHALIGNTCVLHMSNDNFINKEE